MTAFELHKNRHTTLVNRLKKAKAKNVTPLQKDFLSVNPEDYPEVDAIICDPSCSGSGMALHAQNDPVLERILQQFCTKDVKVPNESNARVLQLA